MESAALNNAFLTNWFRPSRGVCQGCPLSPYLFILSAEVMPDKIRQDLHIKGIDCGEHDSIDHTFNDCEFVKLFVKKCHRLV